MTHGTGKKMSELGDDPKAENDLNEAQNIMQAAGMSIQC